jgi:hypothetical protein
VSQFSARAIAYLYGVAAMLALLAILEAMPSG